MEIWECVSQAYTRKYNEDINKMLKMQVQSVPAMPSPEKCFELFNLGVNGMLIKWNT